MRKSLLVLFCIFICSFFHETKAQSALSKPGKFKIITLGNSHSEQELTTALENADWCGYFHKTKNYTLKFDDGAVVELLSVIQLTTKGIAPDPACVQEESTSDTSIYGIHSSGVITKQIPKDSHVKSFEKK